MLTLTAQLILQMLEVYDCSREELRIGPFSYEPMRAVDIWLQQGDDFLLQSLSSSPEVAPPLFVPNLRTTLRRIKDDPYPSVTLFHNNLPRYYRKDGATGQWIRFHYKHEEPPPSLAPVLSSSLPPVPPWTAVPQPVMSSWPHIPPTQTYY